MRTRIALVLQDAAYEFADVSFVVDHKNFGRHYATPSPARAMLILQLGFGLHGHADIDPRAVCVTSSLSPSQIRPPWSSMIRVTMASPRPTPFFRVVT